MRKFGKKRLVAVMTAIAMATSMMGSMSAMAATVTIDSDVNNGTYWAYRIFEGTADGKTLNLKDIKWGAGFKDVLTYDDNDDTDTEADLLTWAKAVDPNVTAIDLATIVSCLSKSTTDDANARKFAKILNNYIKANEATIIRKKLSNGMNDLDGGYYLVVHEANEIRNPSLLQVVGDQTITITAKTDIPTVEKKIWENDYLLDHTNAADTEFNSGVSSDLVNNQWNDAADYDMNTDIPFKLTAKIPKGTTTEYEKYPIEFVDTMDPGLTLTAEEPVVYYQIGLNGTIHKVTNKSLYEATKTRSGFNLKVNDVKTLTTDVDSDDMYIYVTFKAKLTSADVATPSQAAGKENTVILKYANDYTVDYTDKELDGETDEDTVVALTFDIDVDKYTGDIDTGTRLKGAVFELYRCPEGFDAKAEGALGVTIDANKNATWDYATSNNLKALKFTQPTADIAKYVYGNSTGDTILTTGNDGQLNLHGLDRGEYILVEKKAPENYNVLTSAMVVEIKRTSDVYDSEERNGKEYIKGTHAGANLKPVIFTFAVDNNNKTSNKVSVENRTGGLLPETGGAGTMMLYILGTALMAGGVFFLTAKGKKKEDMQ